MTTPQPSKGRDGVTAEKLLDKILGHINLGKEHKHCGRVAAIEAIEQATREAYEEGFLECRFRAEEIADDHNGCIDKKCLTESNCGATIANQVRALHPKGGAK